MDKRDREHVLDHAAFLRGLAEDESDYDKGDRLDAIKGPQICQAAAELRRLGKAMTPPNPAFLDRNRPKHFIGVYPITE